MPGSEKKRLTSFMKNKKSINDDYESPVRKLLSVAHNTTYVALKDLKDAKKHNDSTMIMEADWGGQILVVCPVSLVKCSERTLEDLLKLLGNLTWKSNKGKGQAVFYEIRKIGEGISGGMGGGIVEDGLWVHEELSHLKSEIKSVIYNESTVVALKKSIVTSNRAK